MIVADHIVLYKGKVAAEMVDEYQWIQDGGSLNMMALQSFAFGELNFSAIAWSFTPEEETAEECRKFVARRQEISGTWLIRMQIPKAFPNGLSPKDLWNGPRPERIRVALPNSDSTTITV